MSLIDGLGGHTYFELAFSQSKLVRGSLIEFGFLLTEEKRDWLPTRLASWLRHVFNIEDSSH